MRKYIVILVIATLLVGFKGEEGFLTDQLRYARVKKAFEEREMEVRTKLGLAGLNADRYDLYIRAFKTEGTLEVWGKHKHERVYRLIDNYAYCSNVGTVGPKRQQGDLQIPEGFYHLSKFNPESNYHLSLKVSYPNKSDSMLSQHADLGGQIFIHGGCLTVGCIPITDFFIEELYIMAVLARQSGQNEIPIHIFPSRMNYSNYRKLMNEAPNLEMQTFWTNLKPVYQHFEETGQLYNININHQGRYLFTE
ncbi:MAG: hypothetical protein JJ975_15545 [Bacteroidia bacterium]|nr:hypothetical protein [Bacteroidia bacterium]